MKHTQQMSQKEKNQSSLNRQWPDEDTTLDKGIELLDKLIKDKQKTKK